MTVVVWVSWPLVAVIVTVNVPLLVVEGTLTVNVEEPELMIDVGLGVAVNPPPEAIAFRETVPVNPFRAVTVILVVSEDPLLIIKVLGDADTEKSGVVTVYFIVVV